MLELIDTRYGRMLVLTHDHYITGSLRAYGEYCEEEMELLRLFIKPGAHALDIGANIGAHTLVMARCAGPGGLVTAYEPQDVIYNILTLNVRANGCGNVVPLPLGVGAAPQQLYHERLDYTRLGNFGALGLRAAPLAPGSVVLVEALDYTPFPRLDFVKIDVEGMELDVLQGGARVLRAHRPVLYVENDRVEKSEELIAYLQQVLGYTCYFHLCPLYSPANYNRNVGDIFGNTVAINMLCLPAEQEPDRTLAALPPPFNRLVRVAGTDFHPLKVH